MLYPAISRLAYMLLYSPISASICSVPSCYSLLQPLIICYSLVCTLALRSTVFCYSPVCIPVLQSAIVWFALLSHDLFKPGLY